jgi:hypothetical protein
MCGRLRSLGPLKRERMAGVDVKECPACARLREEYWSLHADYVGARDELSMTRKNDPSYAAKKQEVERLDGLKRDTFHRSSLHLQDHRMGA